MGVEVKEQPSGISSLFFRAGHQHHLGMFLLFFCFVSVIGFVWVVFCFETKIFCSPEELELLIVPRLPSGAGIVSMRHTCFASGKRDQSSKHTTFWGSSSFTCAAVTWEPDHRLESHSQNSAHSPGLRASASADPSDGTSSLRTTVGESTPPDPISLVTWDHSTNWQWCAQLWKRRSDSPSLNSKMFWSSWE